MQDDKISRRLTSKEWAFIRALRDCKILSVSLLLQSTISQFEVFSASDPLGFSDRGIAEAKNLLDMYKAPPKTKG